MRIQHNIMAMNAYRNYTNNTSALSKNLEKLSSGYKINRAGDDAAGLAISEKMRAQITGLSKAQDNAKDGISLVQTAEGALTEVHDMLNRMYELAEQSANGTYEDETDRVQLQKEVKNLKDEINRIADATNFNGINLLDGSLAGGSQVENVAMDQSVAIKGVYTTGNFEATQDLSGLTKEDIGKTLDYTFTWKTGDGTEKTTTVSLTFQGDGTGSVSGTATNNYFTDASGNKYYLGGGSTLTAAQQQDAVIAGLKADKDFSNAFDVKESGNGIEFTAKVDGTAGASVIGVSVSETTSLDKADAFGATNTIEGSVTVTTQAMDSMQKFDASKLGMADSSMTKEEIEAEIFEIDGHKFLLNNINGDTGLTNDQIKALDPDVTVIDVDVAGGATLTADDTQKIAAQISKVTGMETKVYDGGTKAVYTLDVNTPASYADGDTIIIDGVTLTVGNGGGANDITATDANNQDALGAKLAAALAAGGTVSQNYNVTYDGGKLTFTAKTAGAIGGDGPADAISAFTNTGNLAAGGGTAVALNNLQNTTAGADGVIDPNSGISPTDIVFTKDTLSLTGNSLTLQIGDTSDSFNQLTVSINDCHTDALGIDSLDIGTQSGAQDALDIIEAAINYVSDVRGTLGATQNRLDHTINNLSVMEENIQDAESTIRDTDVADEMMAYTKNNILIQSAQAMLAQANQVPQGVLQLLQ